MATEIFSAPRHEKQREALISKLRKSGAEVRLFPEVEAVTPAAWHERMSDAQREALLEKWTRRGWEIRWKLEVRYPERPESSPP